MKGATGTVLIGLALACSSHQPPKAPPSCEGSWGLIDGAKPASPLLTKAMERAHAAGAGDGGQIALDAGSTGDRITQLLDVPVAECALLLARAGQSVVDVDLFAFGDDGRLLGADESADKTPMLLVCPPHPRRILVSARIAAGYGTVAIAALPVQADSAPVIAKRMGIAGAPGGPPTAQAWPGLDDRVAEHRSQIGGQWVEVRRTVVPLEPFAATRVSTAIEAGRCLDILIVPAPEVSHLDAEVQTFDGRIVGRAAAAGRTRSLIACSETTTPITLSIRPRSGRGLGALVLARSQGDPPEDGDEVLRFYATPTAGLPDVVDRLERRLDRQGYRQKKTVAEGNLILGQRQGVRVDLTTGCARIDVPVGEPARGVRAWLWAADGRLIGDARGGEDAFIIACGPRQTARLDLEATATGGPFAVELRPDPNTPPVLEQHALAASRLIQRMIARGVLLRPDQLGTAEPLQLDPSRLVTKDVLVPVGRCVEVGVGLGPESVGVELRLLDADSGSEIETATGTAAATARACSLDRGATLNVRAELRTTSLPGTALVATRMLAPMK